MSVFAGMTVWIIVATVSLATAADIDKTETGLRGGESVFGVNASTAPSPFVNSDNYSLMAFGDNSGSYDDVSFEAFGIFSNQQVDIENLGSIELTATGGNTSNSGDAYANVEAWGIVTDGDVANTSSITVAAMGGKANASDEAEAVAVACGIASGGDGTNNTDIAVTAQGGVSSSQTNYADSLAEACGIDTQGDLNNSGDITVTAMGGYSTSDSGMGSYGYGGAWGIFTDGDVTNSGAITVTANGGTIFGAGGDEAWAEAYGIDALGSVINNGDITVTATGGAVTGTISWADAFAIGIESHGAITNNGNITVSANGGTASGTNSFAGAGAAGIYGSDAITNSGNIRVSATSQEGFDSEAYGIRFRNTGSLTNTGIIQAFGDTAFEVAVMTGTVTVVDTYNLNLDGDPNVGSLYVADGAALDLNDATLSLSSAGGNSLLYNEFRIFTTDGTGTVSGAFSGLADPLNPAIVAHYYDQATAASVDDTVSLSYQPTASPSLEGIDLVRHTLTVSNNLAGQHLTNAFLQTRLTASNPLKPRMYADAGTLATDAGVDRSRPAGGIFLTPYYVNIDKDAAPAGYEADMVGFVTGYERLERDHLYGFHLGFGHTEVDYTGTGYTLNEEDQEILTIGLNAMKNWGDWTLRGQLTGFYSWHDYEGRTGVALSQHESADYDSYGATSTLMGGYLFQLGDHLLLPEAGLDYLWLNRDSFTTDADDSHWDVRHSSLDEHQLTAVGSLRWLTSRPMGKAIVTPSVAAGVRYLLTDDELDAHLSVAGSGPVSVKTEQDDVAGTVSASLLISEKSFSTEFTYAGEFSDDTTLHSAWLRFNYRF